MATDNAIYTSKNIDPYDTLIAVNPLRSGRRAQVVVGVVEGNSIDAVVRMTAAPKQTVLNRLRDLGSAATYHHRGKVVARKFMQDRISRIVGRPQIATDTRHPYLRAIEEAFGLYADCAMSHKIYGAPRLGDHKSLRGTPAMEAGLTDDVWTLEELSGPLEPFADSETLVQRHHSGVDLRPE